MISLLGYVLLQPLWIDYLMNPEWLFQIGNWLCCLGYEYLFVGRMCWIFAFLFGESPKILSYFPTNFESWSCILAIQNSISLV